MGQVMCCSGPGRGGHGHDPAAAEDAGIAGGDRRNREWQWREMSPPAAGIAVTAIPAASVVAAVSNRWADSWSSKSRSHSHSRSRSRNQSWIGEATTANVSNAGATYVGSSSPSESFNAQRFELASSVASVHTPLPESRSIESRSASSVQSYKEGGIVTGTSVRPASMDSVSSNSDAGDYERNALTHVTPQSKPFSYRYSFMSKAVHPMPLPVQIEDADNQENHMTSLSQRSPSTEHRNSFRSDSSVQEFKIFDGPSEFGSPQVSPEYIRSFQRHRFGTISANASEFSSPLVGHSFSHFEGSTCRICNRWLSQKSPWSSHRMIRSQDFPASGVLCCGHVYHADCLDQLIPESLKHDPPCPVCDGLLCYSGRGTNLRALIPMQSDSSISSFRGVTDGSSISPSRSNYVYSDPQQKKKNSSSTSKKAFKLLSKKMFFWSKSSKKAPVSGQHLTTPSSIHVPYNIRSTDKFSAGYSRG